MVATLLYMMVLQVYVHHNRNRTKEQRYYEFHQLGRPREGHAHTSQDTSGSMSCSIDAYVIFQWNYLIFEWPVGCMQQCHINFKS